MGFFFTSKKFKEPLNTAVYTTTYVMKENSPITLISHEIDGDWQFMGKEPINDYREIAMVVSLGNVIKHDKSVLKVADLPMGYQAIRKNKSDKWEIIKIEYDESEMKEFGYYCSSCGVYHKEIPMAYCADGPIQYFEIPENERQNRCVLTKDVCVIDDTYFYVRGALELMVEDNNDVFSWGLWIAVEEKYFKRLEEKWKDENRILEPVYIGEIASSLEPYPEIKGLKIKIITRAVGIIPKLELYESNHPLYLEMENGINMDRVIEFARIILPH